MDWYTSPPQSEAGVLAEVPKTKPGSKGKERANAKPPSTTSSTVKIPPHLLSPILPIPTDVSKLSYKSRYAVQRASPLVCPNQSLAVELDVIRRSRALEGEDRSALSYARAISVIKGPYTFASPFSLIVSNTAAH